MGDSKRRRKPAWEKGLPPTPRRSDVLREIVLKHIRFVEARPVPVIYDHVVNDYGATTGRTIYRHLKALLEEGKIVRVQDDLEDTWGYVRAQPPQWDRFQQVYA